MKKTILTLTMAAVLVLSLTGCGSARPAENSAPAADAQVTAEAPAETVVQAAPAAPVRQDGERFEAVIVLEGMEETVQYEHIRNESAGFEMDYEYEDMIRRSDADGECFLSVWDDPDHPENYLEVRYDTGNAELVASAIRATLSGDFDLTEATRTLDGTGECTRIEASVIKGTNRMADHLTAVYIIPAPDGCRIATTHASIEAAEGFWRRFDYMLDTLTLLERPPVESTLSDELALSAIRYYCYDSNPELEGIVNAGEYPVSWGIESSDAQQIVVLYRSYTGAEVRYYIDRATGDTHATEFVPGITPEEMPSEESLNVWDYFG